MRQPKGPEPTTSDSAHTGTPTHLWEAKHPYYCNEGNFFANGYYTRHDSWAEFYECMGDSDVDLNLLFRWDWKRYEADESGPAYEAFQAFFIGQRKGLFFSHECKVTPEDEPAVRAWLLTRLPTLLALWAPLVEVPRG